jgi:hypothetical protein
MQAKAGIQITQAYSMERLSENKMEINIGALGK